MEQLGARVLDEGQRERSRDDGQDLLEIPIKNGGEPTEEEVRFENVT